MSTTTSAANIDTIRAAYAAFADGDIPAVLGVLADDIVWHVPGQNPLSGDYRGREEVLGFFAAIAERSGETFNITVDNVLGDGAGAVAVLTTERGQRAGMQLDTIAVHVWRFDEGLAVGFRGYQSDDHTWNAFWT
jgi:ketosteroid isomerase-like protein